MSVSSLSPLAATVASLIGWAFLPDFLTVTALRLARRAGLAFAQSPAIPTSSRAYRITYSLVIASYLIYTIVAAVYTAPRNLYEVLGCTPGATETDLKYAYRSFAKKFHPDRIGPEGEAAFIVIRDAFETLKSPVKRFAYDRFGPDALEWTAATYREAIHQGLTASLGFYISTTIFTIIVALNNHSQVLVRLFRRSY
ncbi:hypothetical protein BOTBODRAFT_106702 [Botryobasidium botryosum FD-172 SS1]|uniref:J domain-containing protein n=1 Tax=Botryobasidium botryosum (strain FD-172 SS1) TaxID=930990 RepID=A0A067MPJ8_BOTB1|nr:hypothetical protein BOTBODRAFT_106702 [Botryobasidium botryosum FD-172 SS1]